MRPRLKDPANKYLPALGMLGWSYAVFRSLETIVGCTVVGGWL